MASSCSRARELVLLVEDDADNLELMTLLLEDAGFRVLGFASAEATLDNVGDAVPCAVLTDLCLPGLSGAELISRLREHPKRRTLRAFALTGFCKAEVEANAPLLFEDVFRKPVAFDSLLETIRACIPVPASLGHGGDSEGSAFHST